MRNTLSLLLLQSLLSTRLPPKHSLRMVLTSRLPTVRDTFTLCPSPFTNQGIYLLGPLSMPILSHRLSTNISTYSPPSWAPWPSACVTTSTIYLLRDFNRLPSWAHRLSTFQSTLPVFPTVAHWWSTFLVPSTYIYLPST